MQRVNPKKLELHPDAGQVPEMTAEEYAAFLDDVREHGIRVAIEVMPGTLTVVDGRTRSKAAKEAGLPDVPIIDAPLVEGETPLAYMLRSAGLRRHLSPVLRAKMARQLAEHLQSCKNGQTDDTGVLQRCKSTQTDAKTSSRSQAAATYGVSDRSVASMEKVQAKGTKEEIEAVESGKTPLHQAEATITRREKEIKEAAREDPEHFQPFADRLKAGDKPSAIHKDMEKERKRVAKEAGGPLDAAGKPIPEPLRPLFFNLWPKQAAEELETMARNGIDPILRGTEKEAGNFARLDADALTDDLKAVRERLTEAHERVAGARPHSVCRECKGEGCDRCHQTGYLSVADATGKKKAKSPADAYCRRVREVGRLLDKARREMDALAKDPAGARMHWQSITHHVDSAKGSMTAGMPAHRCPYCGGTGEADGATCKPCRGSGAVDRATYKRGCEAVGRPDESGDDE